MRTNINHRDALLRSAMRLSAHVYTLEEMKTAVDHSSLGTIHLYGPLRESWFTDALVANERYSISPLDRYRPSHDLE